MKDYPKDLKIVFKQQPLPFHKRARPAAMASLAAHKQGKFWEYHDVLFENMKKLEDADLEKYAKDVGLNLKKFKKYMAANAGEEQIKRDQALAAKVGIFAIKRTICRRLISGASMSLLSGKIVERAAMLEIRTPMA